MATSSNVRQRKTDASSIKAPSKISVRRSLSSLANHGLPVLAVKILIIKWCDLLTVRTVQNCSFPKTDDCPVGRQ